MTGATAAGGAGARSQGRLSKLITGLFMKHARVAAIEDVAPRFRLVTLDGPALRNVTWQPGQKLQIAMGSPFVGRTYTPLDWDPGEGRTRLLGYAHGDGPGSEWILGLAVGDRCEVFGPRSSLDADRVAPPRALFGDETSIGLAHALVRAEQVSPTRCCFEVGDADISRQVLARLDLDAATLIVRRDNAGHLPALENALKAFVTAGASFVLTGQSGTVQGLRHKLRDHGVPTSRALEKAYWAPGKRGLD
nr:hypothetical protein GCM10017606_24870 [Microbacterium terregens]